MEWLLPFILGWWGTHWWPGIEVDAPRPGGGDPWWGLVIGIVAGVVAVVVLPMAGMSEPMPGAFAAIAIGAVAGHVVRAVLGAVMGKGK